MTAFVTFNYTRYKEPPSPPPPPHSIGGFVDSKADLADVSKTQFPAGKPPPPKAHSIALTKLPLRDPHS